MSSYQRSAIRLTGLLAVGKSWNGFQFKVLESEVVDMVQCQVISVEEIYEKWLVRKG